MKQNTEYRLPCVPEAGCSGSRQPVRGSFRGIAAVLFACALLLGGCSKEPVGDTDGDGLTSITLSTGVMDDVAMSTRSIAGVDETAVKDLWVIQFNSAVPSLLTAPRYFAGGDIALSGDKCTVRMKIKPEASKIYFIANTGDDALFNGVINASEIAAKTLAVNGEASLAPGGALPMCGLFSGTPTAANLGDGSTTLTRAVAKVTFRLASTMPAGAAFRLTGVKVKNVPDVLHPWRDLTKLEPGIYAMNCYPAIDAGFAGEFAVGTQTDYDGFDGTQITFPDIYLPENARGKGTADKEQNKDADHALGGAEGQGNYATYIEVTGVYTGFDHPDTYNVTYRIYLGDDAVKNYNLLRNTHYTVTTTIKSPTDFDTRIETVFISSTDTDVWDYTGKRTGWFVAASADVSASKMIWNDALTACPAGWRLPSLAELDIMYCMRDQWADGSNGFTTKYYWSATEVEDDGSGIEKAYILNFSNGSAAKMEKDVPEYVRCVRDL